MWTGRSPFTSVVIITKSNSLLNQLNGDDFLNPGEGLTGDTTEFLLLVAGVKTMRPRERGNWLEAVNPKAKKSKRNGPTSKLRSGSFHHVKTGF